MPEFTCNPHLECNAFVSFTRCFLYEWFRACGLPWRWVKRRYRVEPGQTLYAWGE